MPRAVPATFHPAPEANPTGALIVMALALPFLAGTCIGIWQVFGPLAGLVYLVALAGTVFLSLYTTRSQDGA